MQLDRTSIALENGQETALVLQVNKRARRIGLRWSVRDDAFVLVLPAAKYKAEGLRFVQGRRAWMGKLLADQPAPVRLADGAPVPVGDENYIIQHRPDLRSGVVLSGDRLLVSGQPEHLPRRVRDWLKAEAARRIQPQVYRFADIVERPVKRISIRDTQTRWGSCSSENRLNFSWRLVLAPSNVMTYVIAHEVSHLREMNHSPRFWRWVEELYPDYRPAQYWLKRNGAALLRAA